MKNVVIDGEVLKTAIEVSGFKVETFAKALGVGKRIIYFYIEGKRNPGLRRLIDISKLLKIPVNELIKKETS